MKKAAEKNVYLEMKEEYSKRFDEGVDRLHRLESAFILATGYFPLNPKDAAFADLEERKKRMCAGFWNTAPVRQIVEEGRTAFALADLFFNCFADAGR